MIRIFGRFYATTVALLVATALSACVATPSPEPAPPHTAAAAPAASASEKTAALSNGAQLATLQFQLLDTNHDGKLSREEASVFTTLGSAFDAADSNHDGFVDIDELITYARAYRAQRAAAKKAASAPQ